MNRDSFSKYIIYYYSLYFKWSSPFDIIAFPYYEKNLFFRQNIVNMYILRNQRQFGIIDYNTFDGT